MSIYKPVSILIKPQPRPLPGQGTQAASTFVPQAMTLTTSWGSSPGSATITYVPVGAYSILTGADVRVKLGVHYFAGICKSDTEVKGSNGKLRTLEFIDARDYLTWDYSFAAFNKPDVRLVNGVRQKRWKHLLPFNYQAWAWTYTSAPLLGYEILYFIMGGPSIGTPWYWDLSDRGLFAGGVLSMPIYDVDCIGGKRLADVLSEICQKAGVVFTLMSTDTQPYYLVFTRKGYGNLPDWPANAVPSNPTNNRKVGYALSGHPTNMCIHGTRNQYQVLDMVMAKDWSAAWEKFVVFEAFADDIYNRDKDPLTNTAFKATPNDPEQYIGRQLANARALEITLREYVTLTGDSTYADNRKFAGRWRMDMPCALYIQTLLYRAFKPAMVSFVNASGNVVPMTAVDIMDKLLCRVSYNASTGDMTAYLNEPVDGNGLALAKGYQVGADLFRNIKSDQWNVDFFKDTNRAWGAASFQIDDSGEGLRFIIFDAPVIVSNDLLVQKDGHTAINAAFTLQVPPVRAALVLEAEPFRYWYGTYPNVSRDQVENVASLNAEYVMKNGFATEILYADGKSSAQYAVEIASALLLRQFAYFEGGYQNIWNGTSDPAVFGTVLTSMVDRIQIQTSPNGLSETVDFTNERGRDYFEPERELDRKTVQNSLFPGQQDLRQKAQDARNIASSFKQMPHIPKLLNRLLSGKLAEDHPLALVWFKGTIPAGTKINVGTPVRKQPTVAGTGGARNGNTAATLPSAATSQDSVFVGVTVRDQEPADKPMYVQTTGLCAARVQGPVSVNDAVGLASGAGDYLVKGGSPSVGTVQQAITDSTTKVVHVMLGAGGGATGEVLPVWI